MATNKNFNLYKVLQSTGLYTPINYGNLSVDTTPIQNAMQSVTNTMHSLGYKTKEEKQKEFEDKIKAMQERTAGLSDADSATDWYHAMETDPAKRAEWDRQAAAVTGHGIGAIATIASAGTMGWIPALVSTGTGYAGGYGGYKLGEAIDKRYGTNTAPWLSFAGGMLGGGLGYKGLLRTANKGWLGTSPYTYLQPEKQHLAYSPQFTKDVIDDIATTSLRSYVPTYGTVKYYGPTMGKTTAAKTNPNLVDFDDYVRPELEQLASELGMTRQQLMMSQDPTVRESARQLMLKSIKEWRQNPNSYGKTLVISKSDVLQDPIFDNQPLVLQRPEFLKRNAARGETDLQNSMDWYASTRRKGGNKLMEWPDPEGVYISELEPFTPDPHHITFTPQSSRGTYGGYTDITTLPFNRVASGKPIFGTSTSRINPDFNDAIAIRDFAKQYGYQIPKGIERYSGEMLDNYYKKILKQHNTFGRGVTPTETVNAKTQLVYPYSQSMYHGATMPIAQNGVYTLASTSPYGSVSGVIQRHLDFTGPRSTWIQKNVVQPRYYDDVSNAISRRLISDPVYKDFLLKGDYDGMWKYIEKQYPKLFDSRGRIFTQTLMPNKGTFILGGIDNNSIGTVRNMFTPYSSDPKLSTRGFSKMKAKPYDIFDDDLRMLDDGNIIGFKSQEINK